MKKISILFCLLSLSVCAQINKSFDFGISAPFSYDSKIPAPALTPNINYCTGRHQFQIGLDIYSNMVKDLHNIVGPHVAYKYLFRDETKIFNVFGDFNLQYVQYGVGQANSVPYNYLPTDLDHAGYNMVQTQSLINTLGLGLSVTLKKRASLIFVIGGGYNYYQSKNSPTSSISYSYYGYTGAGGYPEGNYIKPIVYTRLGLTIKLWKNY
jgi:hypothetical protein